MEIIIDGIECIIIRILTNLGENSLVSDCLDRIRIWDVTLRDGEQAAGVSFTKKDKIELAKALDRMGIGLLDIGFPLVSKEEKNAIEAIARLNLRADFGVTVRADIDDINCALDCGAKRVFIFAPTSEILIHYKFSGHSHQVRKKILQAVRYSIRQGLDVFFCV